MRLQLNAAVQRVQAMSAMAVVSWVGDDSLVHSSRRGVDLGIPADLSSMRRRWSCQ